MTRFKFLGYAKVIETLKAGGFFVSDGGMIALYDRERRYVGAFTRSTRTAVRKRLKTWYHETSRHESMVAK